MRRKRGNRGTWLPVLPTALTQDEGETQYATWYESPYSIPSSLSAYNQTPVAVPLLPDFTLQDEDLSGLNSQATMRDLVEGQDYLLKRTVGKVWATATNRAQTGLPSGPYLFCLAIAVLPVQDEQQNVPAMPASDYSPLLSSNSQQPWMWRRTWLLQNTIQAAALPTDLPAYGAQSTWQYGSVADGGHLDSKVMRRVRKDQRLFIVAQGAQLLAGEDAEFPQDIRWGYDLRFFGAMRRASNKSTFK